MLLAQSMSRLFVVAAAASFLLGCGGDPSADPYVAPASPPARDRSPDDGAGLPTPGAGETAACKLDVVLSISVGERMRDEQGHLAAGVAGLVPRSAPRASTIASPSYRATR